MAPVTGNCSNQPQTPGNGNSALARTQAADFALECRASLIDDNLAVQPIQEFPMSDLTNLFTNNSRWAASMTAQDPDFFHRLSAQQAPEYLWIGCSDSRVPANEIVGLLPGELFVHRNVANVVGHTDLNCLSVMQYATDVLQGEAHHRLRPLWLWRRAVGRAPEQARSDRQLAALCAGCPSKHAGTVNAIDCDQERIRRMCELNVIEQVLNVSQTTVVQDAWDRGQPLTINGWIYGIEDGLLRDLGMGASSLVEATERYHQTIANLLK
jgi:carbonic anhydrase